MGLLSPQKIISIQSINMDLTILLLGCLEHFLFVKLLGFSFLPPQPVYCFMRSTMPLDWDVEASSSSYLSPTSMSSSVLQKAHSLTSLTRGTKRSLSDPHISMPVRLPPWYIRVSLYLMMIVCFCFVLFWTPGNFRFIVHMKRFEQLEQLI